ncbi:MAG: hypothetical protein ACTSU5_01825 [Promethearchaeota archaeon]
MALPDHEDLRIPEFNVWDGTERTYEYYLAEEFSAFKDVKITTGITLEMLMENSEKIVKYVVFEQHLLENPRLSRGFSQHFDFSTDLERWGTLLTTINGDVPDYMYTNQPTTIKLTFDPPGALSASYELVPVACRYHIYEGDGKKLAHTEALDHGFNISFAKAQADDFLFNISYFGLDTNIVVYLEMWYLLTDGFGGIDSTGYYVSPNMSIRVVADHYANLDYLNIQHLYYPGLTSPVMWGYFRDLSVGMTQEESIVFKDRMHLKFDISLTVHANTTDAFEFSPSVTDFTRLLKGSYMDVYYQRRWLTGIELAGFQAAGYSILDDYTDDLAGSFNFEEMTWKCDITQTSNTSYTARMYARVVISEPTSVDWVRDYKEIRVDCYRSNLREVFSSDLMGLHSEILSEPEKIQIGLFMFEGRVIYNVPEIASIVGTAVVVPLVILWKYRRRERRSAKPFEGSSIAATKHPGRVAKIFHNARIIPLSESPDFSSPDSLLVSGEGKVLGVAELGVIRNLPLGELQELCSKRLGRVVPFNEEVATYDLGGRLITPVFVDSGFPISQVARELNIVDGAGGDLPSILEKLPERAPYVVVINAGVLSDHETFNRIPYPVFIFGQEETVLNHAAMKKLGVQRPVLGKAEFEPSSELFDDLIAKSGFAGLSLFRALMLAKRKGFGALAVLGGDVLSDTKLLEGVLHSAGFEPLPDLALLLDDPRKVEEELPPVQSRFVTADNIFEVREKQKRVRGNPPRFYLTISHFPRKVIENLDELHDPVFLIKGNWDGCRDAINILKGRGGVLLDPGALAGNLDLLGDRIGVAGLGEMENPLDFVRALSSERELGPTQVRNLLKCLTINNSAILSLPGGPIEVGNYANFTLLGPAGVDFTPAGLAANCESVFLRGVPSRDLVLEPEILRANSPREEGGRKESGGRVGRGAPSERREEKVVKFTTIVAAMLVGIIPAIKISVDFQSMVASGEIYSMISIFSLVATSGAFVMGGTKSHSGGGRTDGFTLGVLIFTRAMLVVSILVTAIPWFSVALVLGSTMLLEPTIDQKSEIPKLSGVIGVLGVALLSVLDYSMFVSRFWIHVTASLLAFGLVATLKHDKFPYTDSRLVRRKWAVQIVIFSASLVAVTFAAAYRVYAKSQVTLDLSGFSRVLGLSILSVAVCVHASREWVYEIDTPLVMGGVHLLPYVLLGANLSALLAVVLFEDQYVAIAIGIELLLFGALVEHLLGRDWRLEEKLRGPVWFALLGLVTWFPQSWLNFLVLSSVIATVSRLVYRRVMGEKVDSCHHFGLDLWPITLVLYLSFILNGHGVAFLIMVSYYLAVEKFAVTSLPPRGEPNLVSAGVVVAEGGLVGAFFIHFFVVEVFNWGPFSTIAGFVAVVLACALIWEWGVQDRRWKVASVAAVLVGFTLNAVGQNLGLYGGSNNFFSSIWDFDIWGHFIAGCIVSIVILAFTRIDGGERAGSAKILFTKLLGYSLLVSACWEIGETVFDYNLEMVGFASVVFWNSFQDIIMNFAGLIVVFAFHLAYMRRRKSVLASSRKKRPRPEFGVDDGIEDYVDVEMEVVELNGRSVLIAAPTRWAGKSAWIPRSAILGGERIRTPVGGPRHYAISRKYIEKRGDLLQMFKKAPPTSSWRANHRI